MSIKQTCAWFGSSSLRRVIWSCINTHHAITSNPLLVYRRKDSISTSIISSWVLNRLVWFGSSSPRRVIWSSVANVPSHINLLRLNLPHNLYSTTWRTSMVMILTMLRWPCHLSELLRTIITLLRGDDPGNLYVLYSFYKNKHQCL